MDNETVFNYGNRSFPPLLRVSTIDTVKLRGVTTHPYFTPILSQLRMSIGFYLSSLGRARKTNHELIQQLERGITPL
ncbi:MAG: hypothetical protein R3345_10650 [Fulvivirga sp.]|nr:hypothetical protein [Fulvivirga sp.]